MAERMFNIQRSATQNATELQDFLKDLNDWEGDIKKKDDQLKSTKKDEEKTLPPVRGSQPPSSKEKNKKKAKAKENKENGNGTVKGAMNESCSGAASSKTLPSSMPKMPSVPRDYRAWDKVNVDAMLAELEIGQDEVKKVESSTETESEEEEEEEEDEEMTLMKRKQKATFEKERGNEFFKKGDYDRAIECYTTGITNDAESAVLLANRAMALLNQEKYGAAEADCDAALELDPSYVKALMRRGSARVALKKFEGAKTDFDDVLFLEPRNKQAHQELIKVKKLIDRRGFEEKTADKDRNNANNKTVKFAEEATDVTTTTTTTTTTQKAPSERVNSRWVTPISKPEEAVSKKPLRRIPIEEVGLTKEEMESKRSLDEKSKNRLNQMSENDLKFFKAVGGGGEEEEMQIDLTSSKDERKDDVKARIQVLGKKSNKKSKEPKGSDDAKTSFSVAAPSVSSSSSVAAPSVSSSVVSKSSPKIQVLPESKIDQRRQNSATEERSKSAVSPDGDDNPLQKSRLSGGGVESDDYYWQSVARDLDPGRVAVSKSYKSASEVIERKRQRLGSGNASSSSSASKDGGAAVATPQSSKILTKSDPSVPPTFDAPSQLPPTPTTTLQLPPVPTTALQLQNNLQKLKKQSTNLAFNYLASVPPASLPTIIKNMLDTDLLMSIVDTFHRAVIVDESSTSDAADFPAYLTALARTSRFDMAVMFLASRDKKMIKELIDGGAGSGEKDFLSKKFGI